MNRYTKEEASKIITANPEMKEVFNEFYDYYITGDLDCSTDFTKNCAINCFNLIEDMSKVVIQYCKDEDDDASEVIADSLEEAIAIMFELDR